MALINKDEDPGNHDEVWTGGAYGQSAGGAFW
jgi:hypothetical protein